MVSTPSPAARIPEGVPKRTALPSRWPSARLGSASGASEPIAVEPGAQNSGDRAIEIRDGGKQGRPDFTWRGIGRTVIGRRVIAQSGPVNRPSDPASPQIGFGQ